MSRLRRTSALLATAALAAGLAATAPASTAATAGGNPIGNATGGGSADPVGDVQPASDQIVLTQDEIDSVDITQLTWKVINGRYVSFKLHLVDVQPPGVHRTFYGAVAHAGRGTVYLAARKKGVVVQDDTGIHRCRGSKTRVDEQHDVVRLQLPVRCLSGKRYNFAPIALLEEANGGADLASDETRRTGRVKVR